MSKQSADPTFSPLLLLVPLPFVLATCLPLDIDHSRAADPKVQQVQHAAAAQAETSDPVALEPARSASQPAQRTRRPLHPH